MINTILGSKQRMTSTYVENTRVPVTMVQAGPCVITHIKTMDRDGYWAIQLGFGTRKIKNASKALQGHLKSTTKENQKTTPLYLREIRLNEEPELKVGDAVELSDIFTIGDTVSVTGVSKGKGFAGVVKRWKFSGGPKTHGQSDRHRAPGSIGQGTTPGRVYKGKKMAGRMGGDKTTVRNLKVALLDSEKSLLGVSGPIPGPDSALLVIKRVSESKVNDKAQEENIPAEVTNE